MNGLDYVLIGVGIFCVVRGLFRGAISQIFGALGIIGGYLVALHFYEPLGAQLHRSFPKFAWTQAVAFVLLLFLTWLCVSIVGSWFSRLLQKTGLGCLDRFWGGIVGLWKAVLWAICIMTILTVFLSPRNPVLIQSVMAPYVQEAARFMVNAAPEKVQKLFDEKQRELKSYWLEHQQQILDPLNPLRQEQQNRREQDS